MRVNKIEYFVQLYFILHLRENNYLYGKSKIQKHIIFILLICLKTFREWSKILYNYCISLCSYQENCSQGIMYREDGKYHLVSLYKWWKKFQQNLVHVSCKKEIRDILHLDFGLFNFGGFLSNCPMFFFHYKKRI